MMTIFNVLFSKLNFVCKLLKFKITLRILLEFMKYTYKLHINLEHLKFVKIQMLRYK